MDEDGHGIDFDWDKENIRHLKTRRVSPTEFEQVITGNPLYLDYQNAADEERYKVLGATKADRVLIAVWTPREGRVRAVTAYAANRKYREIYRESGA
ncbi:MAG TPA: BrnT family toxin [Bryobacteraceae bacterium]|nr:BrnT family toxin [Bryobacteraceae bacterium]